MLYQTTSCAPPLYPPILGEIPAGFPKWMELGGHFAPGLGAARGADAAPGHGSCPPPKRSAAARELRSGAQRVIPARQFPGRPCLFLSLVIIIVVVMIVPVVLVPGTMDL